MDPGSARPCCWRTLDNESHPFTAAVEATLDRMSEELDADELGQGSVDVTADEDETKTKTNAPSGADGGLVRCLDASRRILRVGTSGTACRT